MAREILRVGGRLRVTDDQDGTVYYEYIQVPTYRITRSFDLTPASVEKAKMFDDRYTPVILYRDAPGGQWTILEIEDCFDRMSCWDWLDAREARYRGEKVK